MILTTFSIAAGPLSPAFSQQTAVTGPSDTSPSTPAALNPPAPSTPEVPPSISSSTTPAPATATSAPTPAPSAPAGPAPDSNEALLERLPQLSTDHLEGLVSLYQRLGNTDMAAAVIAELRKRNPSASFEPEAVGGADSREPDDYTPVSPFDAIEDDADRLMKLERPVDAIEVLEKARTRLSKNRPFPLELQLASAYYMASRKDDAVASFQRVADGKTYSTLDRGIARKELAAIQLDDDIAATSLELLSGDRKLGLARAIELNNAHPGNRDTTALYAQALTANGHFKKALPILENLKQTTPAGEPFTELSDYADALYNNGHLKEARFAYEQVAADPTLPIATRDQAKLTSIEIFRQTADSVVTYGEYLSETEGNAYFAELSASSEVRDGIHVGVQTWYDQIELEKDRTIKSSSESNVGAYAFVRPDIGKMHFMDVRVGSADHGELIYALSVGRQAPNELRWGWEAGFYGNHRSDDSLQLIALNGRENRLAASVGGPLPLGMVLSARTGVRTVYAEDAEIGDGFYAELEIGRSLWADKAGRRSLWAAYQGTYEQFDARKLSTGEAQSLRLFDPASGTLIGEELIAPEFNPHGFSLTFDHRINDKFASFLGTGVNYDFSDSEFDYFFSGGVKYLLAQNVELALEAAYYSDGTAAANSASEVIVANARVQVLY